MQRYDEHAVRWRKQWCECLLRTGGVGAANVHGADGGAVLCERQSAVLDTEGPPRAHAELRGGQGAPRGRSPLWRGREGREGEPLGELGLPRESSNGLGIVDPLAAALLALEPFRVKVGDVELVEVVRRGRGGDGRHETRDFATHTRCKRCTRKALETRREGEEEVRQGRVG